MSQKMRQEQIMAILQEQKYVSARYLADVLQYSTATINRDLNAMQRAGMVKRSHGGVETVKAGHLPPLLQRQFYHKQEKRRLAEEAVKQIQEGDTVFLNGGTTVQYMVPFLHQRKKVTVITNSLRVALELGTSELKVICLGGEIRERPYVLGSDETVENAMRYRFDKLFFSVGRITEDGMVNGSEHLLYKILFQNSRETWLLTDRTKLVDRLNTVLCDFSALTGVIADFDFPQKTKERYPNVTFLSLAEA